MIHISVSFRLENKVNKEAASPVVAPAVSVIYNRFEWSITERFMFCFFFVFLRASDYTHTHTLFPGNSPLVLITGIPRFFLSVFFSPQTALSLRILRCELQRIFFLIKCKHILHENILQLKKRQWARKTRMKRVTNVQRSTAPPVG